MLQLILECYLEVSLRSYVLNFKKIILSSLKHSRQQRNKLDSKSM